MKLVICLSLALATVSVAESAVGPWYSGVGGLAVSAYFLYFSTRRGTRLQVDGKDLGQIEGHTWTEDGKVTLHCECGDVEL